MLGMAHTRANMWTYNNLHSSYLYNACWEHYDHKWGRQPPTDMYARKLEHYNNCHVLASLEREQTAPTTNGMRVQK